MLNHPDLILDQMTMRHDALMAEAARHSLLKSARQWRKATRAEAKALAEPEKRVQAIRDAGAVVVKAPVAQATSAALAGSLAACGRHAAGSAR